MPDEKADIKLLTLEEANAVLPKVRTVLKSLRELRDKVLRIQAQIEIEEMTGSDSEGRLSHAAQSAVTLLMDEFQAQTHHFEELLEDLFQMGAHLKDLSTGLIDFYSLRGKEVIFLCWKEGFEASIWFIEAKFRRIQREKDPSDRPSHFRNSLLEAPTKTPTKRPCHHGQANSFFS